MNEFDLKAKEWDQNRLHRDRTEAVARAILSQISIPTRVRALEFGAGTGLLGFELLDRLGKLTLMDTSAEMLNAAAAKVTPENAEKVRIVQFDLETGTFQGEPFDLIFTQMVLHHVGDVALVLAKFHDLLTPGGFLAVADLYPEDGTFHDPGAKVHPGFDPGELAKQLDRLGFREVRHEPCFLIPRPRPGGGVQEFPVFLLTARKG